MRVCNEMTEKNGFKRGHIHNQAHPPFPLYVRGKGRGQGSLGNPVLRLVFVPMFFEPHKVLKIRTPQEGIIGAFVTDGGEWRGAVIVARVDFHTVIEPHDDVEQAVELIFRTRPLGKRATNTSNEQGITRDELAVDQQTNGVHIMPWREQDFDTLLPKLNDIAVIQLDIRVDACLFVGPELYVALVEDVIPSDMIVMRMGVED